MSLLSRIRRDSPVTGRILRAPLLCTSHRSRSESPWRIRGGEQRRRAHRSVCTGSLPPSAPVPETATSPTVTDSTAARARSNETIRCSAGLYRAALDPADEREPSSKLRRFRLFEPSSNHPAGPPPRSSVGGSRSIVRAKACMLAQRSAEVAPPPPRPARNSDLSSPRRRVSLLPWPTRTACSTRIPRLPHRKCGWAFPRRASRECTRPSGCGTATPRSLSRCDPTAPWTSIPRRRACTCRASPSCSRRRSTRW